MKTHTCIIAGMLALLPIHAQVTIGVSTLPSSMPEFRDSGGNLLPNLSYVRVGRFNESGGNLSVIQNSNDFSSLNTLFTPLGEGIFGAGIVNQSIGGTPTGLNHLVVNSFSATPGSIFGNISGINTSYLPAETTLHLWIFNDANMNMATEWGIFSAVTGWSSPNNFGTETLSSGEITRTIRGSSEGGDFLLSPLNGSGNNPGGSGPEPSTTLLGLVSIAFMTLRRNR